MKLEGKIALVTGAASGIGRAIAEVFAKQGVSVAVCDLDVSGAEEVAAQCSSIGPPAVAIRCDVGDSGSVEAAFKACDEALGTIDILVNNAGIINTDPDYLKASSDTSAAQMAELMSTGTVTTHFDTVERISDEAFDRMLKVHLYGTFYCTRQALPRFRASGRGGRIINIGSIMGSACLIGAPDYCAAKGGIMAFTRAVAREAASYGVLVNSVAPGFINTPLLEPVEQAQRELIRMQIPLQHFGEADEIAATVLFLAGPDGRYYTGQSLSPNGGIYMSQ